MTRFSLQGALLRLARYLERFSWQIDGETMETVRNFILGGSKITAKMGSIKDRNGMDLTEAEDIKKRWQE